MTRIRPSLPCEKKPCPDCGRPISTSGRAWAAHQRMHQRAGEQARSMPQLFLEERCA
jgi:hypothetical protein